MNIKLILTYIYESKKLSNFWWKGQIGRSLIRKLTRNNFRVTVVTRNIHQKLSNKQANAGYIDIVESIFDEKTKNFLKADICINLVGILFEQKGNTFKNIHTISHPFYLNFLKNIT